MLWLLAARAQRRGKADLRRCACVGAWWQIEPRPVERSAEEQEEGGRPGQRLRRKRQEPPRARGREGCA
eukprot:1018739-Rhodomonas_salina.1